MKGIDNASEESGNDFLNGNNIRVMDYRAFLQKCGTDIGVTSAIIPGLWKNPEKIQHILCPAVNAAADILDLWVVTHKWVKFIKSDQYELPLFNMAVTMSTGGDGTILIRTSYLSLSDRGSEFIGSLEGDKARLIVKEMIKSELEKLFVTGESIQEIIQNGT